MKLVTRREWGARSPKGRTLINSTRGVKVHYTGDYVDPDLLNHHSKCLAKVRQIQSYHMDKSNDPYVDIGYNALVCPHGYVIVGRGPNILPAANGPGLNSGHYAVCGLVGSKGLTKPPDAMLNGIVDAIMWLRSEGKAGNEIKGHRDGYSTDCPGPYLYEWVRHGAPQIGNGDGEMEPTTSVNVGESNKAEFVHDHYPAGYLWVETLARARRIEKKLDALIETISTLQ